MNEPLKDKKVMVLGGNIDYYRMLAAYGAVVHSINPIHTPPTDDNLRFIDLVMFTGGEDVNPALYGEAKHSRTHCNLERDKVEEIWFNAASRRGIPMVGICRGGQFLNVMNGGKMRQHVSGHATGQTHILHTGDGEEYIVSSTHHQMMLPYKDTGKLLGWGEICLLDGEPDAEIIHYPTSGSLCFQPHPEFFPKGHECVELFMNLVTTKLLNN